MPANIHLRTCCSLPSRNIRGLGTSHEQWRLNSLPHFTGLPRLAGNIDEIARLDTFPN
jgi:hypothetical protein